MKNKIIFPDWAKVGQKIREKRIISISAITNGFNQQIGEKINYGPEGVITEITDRGFNYKYNEIQPFIPRCGMSMAGGGVYLDIIQDLYGENWEKMIGCEPIYEKTTIPE